MEELYKLGISEDTVKGMIELNPEVADMDNSTIIEKERILANINCSDLQITNIISSNPLYLSKTLSELSELFNYLNFLGFSSLNTLIDSNPNILNLEVFELKDYIANRNKNGEDFDLIIDDLESNPYLFDEI